MKLLLKSTFLFSIVILKLVKSQKFEGDACILSNGDKGTCSKIGECLEAVKELKRGIKPKTCGFNDFEPIVCCGLNRKTKSEEYCELLRKKVKHVENTGGNAVNISKVYPHTAALGFGTKANIVWNCGGTLISDRFVLTAAHCLRHPKLGEVRFVLLGAVRLDGTSNNVQHFEAIRNIRHPYYRPPLVYNDIGLTELNRPIVLSFHVKPACLYPGDLIPQIPLTTINWKPGQGYSGETSITLKKSKVSISNHEQCAIAYSYASSKKLSSGILEDRQICANSNEDKSTCQALSGGPLQTFNYNEELYGIVGFSNFGKTCSTPDVPDVYTRLTYYIPWIENIVWPY